MSGDLHVHTCCKGRSVSAATGKSYTKNKTIMASSKESDTSAAAEQLGSLSLGGDRKGEPEAKNEDDTNGTPTKLCSKCGKESDTLKKCTACKCVWYCDKECQNRHWKEHKTECKPIKKALAKRGGKLDLGNELDLGPLPDLPPREECPICMRVLPIHAKLQTYFPCCGKTVCGSCGFQHKIKAIDENDKRAQKKQPQAPRTCEFCRTKLPESDEEILDRLRKRVELKDPEALFEMALYYRDGDSGLSVDQVKCIELLRESADLGFPDAQYQLGIYHYNGTMGLEQNDEEALELYKEAAEGGDITALYNLGGIESNNGDRVAAMRHFRLSASGGYLISTEALIFFFEVGMLRHGDLAETLQAFYRSRAEMKSEDRDKYIAYLKETGEYEAKYEW